MELLTTKKQEVQIEDRQYKIGALSFQNVVKDIPAYVQKVIDKFMDVKEWGKNNVEDMRIILDKLSAEEAAELFSIILKEPDKQFIIEHILCDINIAFRILVIVYENNKELFANFQKAMGKTVLPKKQEIKEASPEKV